jgi:hypothetical protein
MQRIYIWHASVYVHRTGASKKYVPYALPDKSMTIKLLVCMRTSPIPHRLDFVLHTV